MFHWINCRVAMGLIGSLSPKNVRRRAWTVLFPELAVRGEGAEQLRDGVSGVLVAFYIMTRVFEPSRRHELQRLSPGAVLSAALSRMASGQVGPADLAASLLITIMLFAGLVVG